MKDCPTCKTPVDGLTCPVCNPTTPKAKKSKPKPTPDTHWQQCANEYLGLRCTNAGAFSHSTLGGGPWLCWQHFAPHAPRFIDGKPSGPPGGFDALRNQLKPPDYETALERLAIKTEGRE